MLPPQDYDLTMTLNMEDNAQANLRSTLRVAKQESATSSSEQIGVFRMFPVRN